MTDLSPEAKDLLRVAREEYSPADQRVASVRSALQQRLASGGGAGGLGAAGSGAAGIARLLGLGLVATALATLLVIGARKGGHSSAGDGVVHSVARAPAAPIEDAPQTAAAPPERAAAPAVQPVQVEAVRSASPLRIGNDQPSANADDPRSVTHVTRPRVSSPHAAGGAVNEFASAAPHRRSSPAMTGAIDRTRAASPEAAPGVRESPAGDATAPVAAAAVAHPAAPSPPDANKPPADDSLAREVQLLSRARDALAHHDALAALALTDEHAALYANGTMRQERLATRVLALCALHRPDEARAAKRELERIAPRSPHWMRIRTSCAAEDTSKESE